MFCVGTHPFSYEVVGDIVRREEIERLTTEEE
jgi:hypothetical protein